MDKKVFLDFDGVLFDTVKEAFAVAMITHKKANSINKVDFKSRTYQRFRSLRHLVGPASDYLFMVPIAESDCSLAEAHQEFGIQKGKITDEEKLKFQEAFFEVRRELRKTDHLNWSRLNSEFEFFAEIAVLIGKYPESFCVVTTKDRGTVSHLMQSYGVDNELDIYDANTFLEFGDKKSIIASIIEKEGISKSIFIDDSSHHLNKCEELDGVLLVQPDWGYLSPSEKGDSCRRVVNSLLSFFNEKELQDKIEESSMFGIERKLYVQLCKLRDKYDLKGIKAEFEAEGSSLRDLARLRRITDRAGIALFLKIGGVEAVRDIKDSLEIGVDGLIAPMCETAFGVKKFVDAYKDVYGDHKIHLSINVETKNAVDTLDEIMNVAEGFIDNITIGRSDLSGSYFDPQIKPDSDFIFEKLEMVNEKLKNSPMTMTVGGSLSTKTREAFLERKDLLDGISKLETRKVMLPPRVMIESDNALEECLKFEELYILAKKEIQDLFINSEINRLTQLQRRL